MLDLLHPQFVAVHGPVGAIDNAEQFVAQANARPRPGRVRSHAPTIHEFGDAATVACIQEWEFELTAGAPPFVMQAAASRVWIRSEGNWRLALLQMSRRLPPA
ncbi:nuclear transport factor 2 family protein [Mycobacterium sp. 1465703.0]|uniref:nuclear transport factor 2 family protein n=1 Tax=Mycobacterium sp. 1465703.0 TaxID=1834078 RepID=UPI003519A420